VEPLLTKQEKNQSQKKVFLDSLLLDLNDFKNDSTKSKLLFEIAAEYYYLKEIKLSHKVSKIILDEAKLRKAFNRIAKRGAFMARKGGDAVNNKEINFREIEDNFIRSVEEYR
jgi:hypothetical protein